MGIQTDVTLQPDYTCCLRVMGINPALQKLLFDHLISVPVFDYCKYYSKPRLSRIQVDWGILSELRENPT